jgi:hypothetical protein
MIALQSFSFSLSCSYFLQTCKYFFLHFFSPLKDTERRDSIPEEDNSGALLAAGQLRQMKPIYEIDKQANNECEPSTTTTNASEEKKEEKEVVVEQQKES